MCRRRDDDEGRARERENVERRRKKRKRHLFEDKGWSYRRGRYIYTATTSDPAIFTIHSIIHNRCCDVCSVPDVEITNTPPRISLFRPPEAKIRDHAHKGENTGEMKRPWHTLPFLFILLLLPSHTSLRCLPLAPSPFTHVTLGLGNRRHAFSLYLAPSVLFSALSRVIFDASDWFRQACTFGRGMFRREKITHRVGTWIV